MELSDAEKRIVEALRMIDDAQFSSRMAAFVESAAQMVRTDKMIARSEATNIIRLNDPRPRT